MASKTYTVRLNEQEQALFTAYASIWGKSVGDMMKSAVMELIEDNHDTHIADIAYQEYQANPTMYTLDEVKAELLNDL